MPIQPYKENGGGILVIHNSGNLVEADYLDLVSEFEGLAPDHGKLSALFDLTGFDGWEASAAWEDFKFCRNHFAEIQRLEMVGEKKWQRGTARHVQRRRCATSISSTPLNGRSDSMKRGRCRGHRHARKIQ